MQQRCIFIILTYLFFHQCEDEGFDAQIIPLCPWFWRRRMLAAKNGEALNERTFGRQKMRLAIPSWWKKRGNDCDVAVGNCVYGCFSPCSRSLRGDEGRGRDGVDGMGDGRRAGNSGREILFLAALTWAPTLKVAPFFLRIFSLPYYHSMVELCYLLNPTLFFCSPYKIPMRK